MTSTKVKWIKTRTITQKKVSTVTRTFYKTATKTLKKRDLEGLEAIEIPISAADFARASSGSENTIAKRSIEPVDAIEEPVDEAVDEPAIDLFARAGGRNLCPVCPKGVKVAGKTAAGSAKYCCPARKTVFKTVKKTSTKRVATSTKVIRKTATKTVTVRRLAMKLYQDG